MKALCLLGLMCTMTVAMGQKPHRAETVPVNDAQIYYEVYGQGEPLMLLHAFTYSSKSWHEFLDAFTGRYEVYLVDMRGHGKSGLFTDDVSIPGVAADLDAFTRHLGLERVHAMGYSFGGEVLFQLALQRPDLIESMVIIGSCGSWSAADFPDFVAYLSYENIEQLTWMREQQESEEQIRSILAQVPKYHVVVTDKELESISVRTLLVTGDRDPAVPLDCLTNAYVRMPNASLWIVPDTEHRAHRGENKEAFINAAKKFLAATGTH